MTEVIHDFEALLEAIEAMPVYGKRRKYEPRLTFGQYLTVLKSWFGSLENEAMEFKAMVRKLRDSLEVQSGTTNAIEVCNRILGEK